MHEYNVQKIKVFKKMPNGLEVVISYFYQITSFTFKENPNFSW